MTREIFTPSPLYTISTAGPHPITHPYQDVAEIACTIFHGATIVELVDSTDFTVSPSSSETTGDVTLSSSIFSAYTGAKLLIRRISVADQGWAGKTALEKGLEAQLDAITQRLQEVDEAVARAIKLPSDRAPELPLDTENLWIGFNSSNVLSVGIPSTTTLITTPFAATLLDDPDADTARVTLGAGVMDNLEDDTTPQLSGALDSNGNPIDWSQGADVASAAELLVLRDGNSFNVTGTTTIASIETTANAWPVGSIIMLKFTGAATLAHHAADLVLLGAADITVAAGDWAVFRKYEVGDWEMVWFSGLSATSDWEAGTSTKPSMCRPSNIKSAITAQTTTSYKSAWVAGLPPINATTPYAHSLGATPDTLVLVLECTTADLGFALGDTMSFTSFFEAQSGTGVNVYGNASTLYIERGNYGWLVPYASASAPLTEANWKHRLIVQAIR